VECSPVEQDLIGRGQSWLWATGRLGFWGSQKMWVEYKPSAIYAIYCRPIWHRHWPAVWTWRDWIIATRYSTARQSAASRCCSVCRTLQPESSSRHRGSPMPNRWCFNYTGCRFNTELTTRCQCWHTRLWTRRYRTNSDNASTAASTHGHCARRLRHCSSNRSLVPASRNVLFDVPRRLSGTHFPRLLSEATHCLYSNVGKNIVI